MLPPGAPSALPPTTRNFPTPARTPRKASDSQGQRGGLQRDFRASARAPRETPVPRAQFVPQALSPSGYPTGSLNAATARPTQPLFGTGAAQKPAPPPDWINLTLTPKELERSVSGQEGKLPEPTDAVRQLLNQQNWKVPEPSKQVRTPDQVFSEKEQKDLLDYKYTIGEQEWRMIRDVYDSPAARAAGYIPPSTPGSVSNTPPKLAVENLQSAPLTQSAYDALTADQRAAVDFNTLLVDAREKDLSKSWNMQAPEMQDYTAKVEEIFGKGGGSETAAPNVVDLLTKVDFKAIGQDLDEYLSLERAVDITELKDFKLTPEAVQNLSVEEAPNTRAEAVIQRNEYAAVRSPENLQAVDAQAVAKSKATIEQAMRDASNALWNFNAAMSGKAINAADAPVGYGLAGTRTDPAIAEKDKWFQGVYNYLANSDNASEGIMAPVWEEMKVFKFTPEDQQEFFNYLDNRTRLESQYGAPVNELQGAKPRTAKDIRKLAGLEG